MNSIERQLLDRYSQKENAVTYYDRVQIVVPNPTQMNTNESLNVITSGGVKRVRKRKFMQNKISI